MIDQLYKLKKVSPCLQLRLDLDSKNVYIIDYIEELKNVDPLGGAKDSAKKQEGQQNRAFSELEPQQQD